MSKAGWQQAFFVLLLIGLLGTQTACEQQSAANEKDTLKKAVSDTQQANSDSLNSQRASQEDPVTKHEESVHRNESFYVIFNRIGLSPQQIYHLTRQHDSLLDQFELKPGQNYQYYIQENDSTSKLEKFVWEPNKRDYLVFDFQDSIRVEHHRRPLTIRRAKAAGVIESSLYETFQDLDLPIALAYELSDLYAWEIDFFLLRRGDAFKVIYEEQYIEGERIGIGDIIAAEFRHREDLFPAYRFYNGSETGYYDAQGESLQKALLKAPLKFRYISSGFSHSRYHPILHRRMPHYGVDYVAPRGTPVVSVGEGTVVTAGYKGPNGNMVKIRHNGTYQSTYIHLSRFAKGIQRGAHVKQGEVIGYVGSTGRSTGPHLDYRLYKHNRPVNPRTIDLPPTDGIQKSYLEAFQYSRSQMDSLLGKLEFSDEERKHPTRVTHSSGRNTNSDEAGAGKSS